MYKYTYILLGDETPAILRADTDEEAKKVFKEKIGDYEIKSMRPFEVDTEKFRRLLNEAGY